MPDEQVGDPGHQGSTIADLAEAAGPGSVDGRHLLLVGAGPGLGMAVARRFAVGGYRVTLVARSPDGFADHPVPALATVSLGKAGSPVGRDNTRR
jgi:hypothetical protein